MFSSARVATRYLTALVVPFRRDREYAELNAFLSRLRSLVGVLEGAQTLIDKAEGPLWNVGMDPVRMPNWGGAQDILRGLTRELAGRKDDPEPPEGYLQEQYYVRENIKYLLERDKDILVRLAQWGVRLHTVLGSQDFRDEVDFNQGSDEGLTDADLRRLSEVATAAVQAPAEIFNMLKRIARTKEHTPLDKLPTTAEIQKLEKMYHASVHARKLAQTGFSLNMPDESGSAGLGGSQSAGGGRKGISFTEDLYVAKEIARVFKEVAMIARGEVTWPQVAEWVKRGGKEAKVMAHFEDYRASDWSPVERTMGLYLSYLNFSGRYDPKFFGVGGPKGLVSKFKGLTPSNIGYIVATVDMSNRDITYGSGEREFRVPVEAIVSVDKFVG